jgi:hypothetical protein
LFGFCPKRVLGTERVTEISFGTLCPGGGRFQASPAEGTFEHFVLLNLRPGMPRAFADGTPLRSPLSSEL